MKIMRFYFTKESEWIRNVYRDDKDGPWCRYEDVKPLLIRIEELEAKLAEIDRKMIELFPVSWDALTDDGDD